MASTYSALKIQLMGTGENSGTWGNVTNVNLGTALEEAIVGSADVTFASGTVTLALTDSNSTQTARNLRLNLTGTSGGAQNLIVPTIEKVYIVNNGCADAITVKNSGGTGIAVPAGKTMYVYNDGTNVVDAVTHLTSLTLGTALPIASGGTGSTSTTYANLQSNVSGILPVANGGTGTNSTTYANLQSNVSGILPTANGGTGSNSTTYANLQSNVSGILPTANGGTGANSLANASIAQLSVVQTFTAGQSGEITGLTDGTTITPDFANSNNFSVTLEGNRTLANPSNIVAGQSGSFFISQDATGGRTLAYGSYYDFAGGTAPTLSTAASAVDRIDYVVRTTTSIHAVFTANYS
jgi:hypothetical protein